MTEFEKKMKPIEDWIDTKMKCKVPKSALYSKEMCAVLIDEYHQEQVTLGLPSVIGRLKSIKRYTESYGEGDFADDGEYVWYEDLEQVIKDFE